jgi:glycine/serine hydroxymethyltransferase
MSGFEDRIEGLFDRIEKNNLWRQRRCINLIPSENTPSPLVKACEMCDPAGRYAEHRSMKNREVYFYQGTDFIRDIEMEAQDALREYFGCAEAELRPVSGQMANEVVFKAVTRFVNRESPQGTFRKLRAVMNNDLGKGGHLSSQPMGALYNFVDINPATGEENCVNFPVRSDNMYRIDTDRLAEVLDSGRPELIVFGKSMFLYPEPVAMVADLVKDWDPRPVIMYDMAHVLGLYGAFQAPLTEGADVVTGSTHKTFFGPQRGVVVSNMDKSSPLRKLWLDIRSRAFPGSTSNHHLATLVGLLVSTLEMNEWKEAYQTQVLKNARAFARHLADNGLQVEGDPADGWTRTHQVVVRVAAHGDGAEVARRLEENNIVVNYQALPDDETFLISSGIRTGVSEMTRFGMDEDDFGPVAELMARCIVKKENVAAEAASYRSKFVEMRYTMPLERSLGLAARSLASAFPTDDYARILADNLHRLAGG